MGDDDFDFSWWFIFALALFLFIGLPLLLGGCADPAPTKHERARVISLPYVPAPARPAHAVGAEPASATYGVVFVCQHRLSSLSGSDEWHERLWKSLREDEWVDVEYRELRDSCGRARVETLSVEPALDSRGNCAFHPKIDKPEGKDCEDCYTDVDKRAVSL